MEEIKKIKIGLRLNSVLRELNISLREARKVLKKEDRDKKWTPTSVINQKQYEILLKEKISLISQNSKKRPLIDDVHITNNWIPKMKEYREKISLEFDKVKADLRKRYEWVNDEFMKSTKGEINQTINNPVVFWVYWRIKIFRGKLGLINSFIDKKITFKDYRNKIEKSKGSTYMLYQLEQLFRNVKTKNNEENY